MEVSNHDASGNGHVIQLVIPHVAIRLVQTFYITSVRSINLSEKFKFEKGSSFQFRSLSKSTPFSPDDSPPPFIMTTAAFKHIDLTSYEGRPWNKVDGPDTSYILKDHIRPVTNIRGREDEFTTDNSGFQIVTSPAKEKLFTDDAAVRNGYYAEIETLLRTTLPGVKKVIIFDHTIRRRQKNSPRQPVQQVHVDQTPDAAEVRVRRHAPSDEVEDLVAGRYQIINVWRPIEHAASDFPLAVIDWRTTSPADYIHVDLLYPKRDSLDADDRGKEIFPDAASFASTAGYEVKGATMAVAPSEAHRYFYVKDMTPEEVMLLKCFDSRGEGMEKGVEGVAVRTPHTAFVDPGTPREAPGRQSIEVRCLVFYD
jgi:hypothetical protein